MTALQAYWLLQQQTLCMLLQLVVISARLQMSLSSHAALRTMKCLQVLLAQLAALCCLFGCLDLACDHQRRIMENTLAVVKNMQLMRLRFLGLKSPCRDHAKRTLMCWAY